MLILFFIVAFNTDSITSQEAGEKLKKSEIHQKQMVKVLLALIIMTVAYLLMLYLAYCIRNHEKVFEICLGTFILFTCCC